MRGFTLIEIIITIAIFAALTTLASINLTIPQTSSSLDAVEQTFTADVRGQQAAAMSGKAGGIVFEETRYVLFTGQTYVAGDQNNFAVNFPTGMRLTNSTFAAGTLIFKKRSGEVVNFVAGQNTITLEHTTSNQQKIFTVNRIGVLTSN